MVIKHAIAFTDSIGEEYLWVDRLCIVQNDLGDGGTLSKVAKMDKIYSGAYLTIVAAAPNKLYKKGISIQWPEVTLESDVESLHNRSSRSATEAVIERDSLSLTVLDEEEVLETMNKRYYMLARSRWATRGWTYQEQILCRRAVVFLKERSLLGLSWCGMGWNRAISKSRPYCWHGTASKYGTTSFFQMVA